jgi:hypothetical protein
VIDGTMGQNALSQARAFHEATPLTAVIVTKLDGTAKGGMILAIAPSSACRWPSSASARSSKTCARSTRTRSSPPSWTPEAEAA